MYNSTRIQTLNQGAAQTLVRAGECILTAIRGYSANTSPASQQAYIQVFDSATAAGITVGATSPNWIVACVSSNVSDGDGLPTYGIAIRNGIVIACTSAPTNATSSNLVVEIGIV